MIWLGWRQQRTETLIAAGLLALIAAILVPTGIEMAHAYAHDQLSRCLGTTSNPVCGDAIRNFQERFDKLTSLVGWFNLVPGLIGAVLAAPFVLDLERGTHRLAWTQSITRRRWVVTKLTLAGASTLVAAAALIIVMIWWRGPFVRLQGRMDNGALGLALAVGAVWRRAVPAVMVAFVGYFGARLFVDGWLRQRLIAPRSLTFTADRADPPALLHAWVISEGPSDALGRSGPIPFGACIRAGKTVANAKQCLALRGGHVHAVFEPASRFWPLQGIETAMFGGLGLALILLAGWWTLHRE